MAQTAMKTGFAEHLRAAREERGWSQMIAAVKVGETMGKTAIPLGTYRTWEAGTKEPGLSHYRAICLTFEWPLPDWMSQNGATRVYPEGESPAEVVRLTLSSE